MNLLRKFWRWVTGTRHEPLSALDRAAHGHPYAKAFTRAARKGRLSE